MRVYSARSAHSAQLVETKGKFAIKFAHRFAHETPVFAQRKTATPKTPEDSRNGGPSPLVPRSFNTARKEKQCLILQLGR